MNRPLAKFAFESPKELLRAKARASREAISQERKNQAAKSIYEQLCIRLGSFSLILSFAPLKGEIDLWQLNQLLAQEKRLALPKRKEQALEAFLVHDLSQLEHGSFGILEPVPMLCEEIPLEKIECVLVPGLLFDRLGHRLGYGKGFYDRLLEKLPLHTRKWGIGFEEQLYQQDLPKEPHDQVLDNLILA